MGTTLGLPRPSSVIGFSGSKVSNLLRISRESEPRYLGESAGVDPEAQERFLEARTVRRQKAIDALHANPELDKATRDQAMSLVPRIGTLAIVSAKNYMHGKREVRKWAESTLEGLDRTGVHRGMATVALQTVLHTDKDKADGSFARYAATLSDIGNRNGFAIDPPLEQLTAPVRHIESGDISFLPEWLTGALQNVDSSPQQNNPYDQGVVILTDEISFTHAVRANVQSTEFAGVFNLAVSEAVGVLSMHDMYANGAVRLSRGSYPY